MRKFNLYPKFPAIGATVPSLEEIEAQNPEIALIFWTSLFFTIVLLVPGILLCYILLTHQYPAVVFLFLQGLSGIAFIDLFFLVKVDIEANKFCIIGEQHDGQINSAEVSHFFERHPELSYYYEEVLRQGRPFYVGEMEALSQKAGDNKIFNKCPVGGKN